VINASVVSKSDAIDAAFCSATHRRRGGRPDLDHRHPAGQLRQPLLQLLAVVVGGRLLDLGPDLLDEMFPPPGQILLDFIPISQYKLYSK